MKLQTALFFFLFSFIINEVSAQTKYGLKAGINFSDQNFESTPPGYPTLKFDSKILIGFQLGAFVKFKLNNKYFLSTEVNYSLIGSKTKYTRTPIVNPDGSISYVTNDEYYNNKIHRIEIPILLQYNINNQFYCGLGPFIAINISSKIDNFQNLSFKTDYYKPIDFGASILIGHTVYEKIDLTIKYNYGLINVDKRDYSTIKNNILNFSILYSFK